MSVGNKFVPSARYNGPGDVAPVLVPADTNSLAVEFSALDYAAPSANRYAYRLDGYDAGWVHVDADHRLAAYTNLPPGRYRLLLKGTDHTGAWVPTALALPIEVQAAWYQTFSFHAAEAVVALVLIALLIHGRTVMLHRRQRELVDLVGRRTLELRRSNDERRALVENVAHDLRTPLASLRGYLETAILKDGSLSASDRRRYLGIAFRQSEHLMRLVRELFDLVRLEEVDIRLSCEPVQLGDLVQDVVQKFGLAAEEKRIVVVAPPAAGLPLINGDINLLERLIDNMFENALRHTPPGGRIAVKVAAEPPWIELEIADTGRGIQTTDLDRIFDRFQRGSDPDTGETAGAGLGLAIVKRIVDLHAGRIAVFSEIGAGTRFSIRFPLEAVPAYSRSAVSENL